MSIWGMFVKLFVLTVLQETFLYIEILYITPKEAIQAYESLVQ